MQLYPRLTMGCGESVTQMRPVCESLWRDWGQRNGSQRQCAGLIHHTGNHIAIGQNIHLARHGRGRQRDDRRAIGGKVIDNNRLACGEIFDARQPRCAKLRLGHQKAVNPRAAIGHIPCASPNDIIAIAAAERV